MTLATKRYIQGLAAGFICGAMVTMVVWYYAL